MLRKKSGLLKINNYKESLLILWIVVVRNIIATFVYIMPSLYPGPSLLDETCVRLAERFVRVVRRPAPADQGAGVLDLGLQPALLGLVVGLL